METPSTTSGDQTLKDKAAHSYLKEIRGTLQGDEAKYKEFIAIMREFKEQRVDITGVIERVMDLFKEQQELILGFDTFLPKGYKIIRPAVVSAEEIKHSEFEEAIQFVKKVKTRFSNDDGVYKSFLKIVNLNCKGRRTTEEVLVEVSKLFQRHIDLLDGFKQFLPKPSAAGGAYLPNSVRSTLHDDRSSFKPVRRNIHVDKRVKAYMSDVDRDIGVDHSDIMHEKQSTYICRENNNEDGRDRNRDENDLKHDNKGLDNLKQNIGKGAGYFVIHSALASSQIDNNTSKSVYAREFNFLEKVKDRLHHSTYHELLECLHTYGKEVIYREELENLVGDILGNYPDLKDGFNDFLVHCENIDGILAGVLNKKQFHKSCDLEINDKERDQRGKKGNYDSVMEKDRERAENCDPSLPKDATGHKVSSTNKENHDIISELDLSNCQHCTPSYRLLPKNYLSPLSSYRTKADAEVLNDVCVLVTSGSEDHAFKHTHKNQFEENLFRCEDDRYELDVLLESVKAATKKVKKLLEQINTSRLESPIHVEDELTALNLRCIERLYGDHGLEVMDILRKNPRVALPVILTRLKQKQEEWLRCRSDFNKVWAEIYAKNHQKSLDHQSFNFKQQDIKSLGSKALLAEIKEINEKKPKEDDALLAIAVGSRRPTVPDMEFQYIDSDLHEDLFQIIKYSCGAVCTSMDEAKKVLRIWTTFLEPMLGIPSRLSSSKDAHDAVKTKRNIVDSVATVPKECCNHDDDRPAKKMKLPIGAGNGDGSAKVAESCSGRAGVGNDSAVDKEDSSNIYPATHKTVNCCSTSPRISDTLPLPEGDGHMRPSSAANGDSMIVASGNCFKDEREEGEISPDRDFEDKFVGFDKYPRDVDVPESKVSSASRLFQVTKQVKVRRGEDVDQCGAGSHDEGKRSPQRSTNSDNTSKAAEDVSGSDYVQVEDCSREDGKEGGTSLLCSEHFLNTVRPLARHVPLDLQDQENKSSHIFYGNDSFYVMFRLHQILYDRILLVKSNSISAEQKMKSIKYIKSPHLYDNFMSALYDLLDGSSDNTKFEDECRSIIGTQSYVLFTLDKLIYKLVKQLRVVASDETHDKVLQLYTYERSRKDGRQIDLTYYENANAILYDERLFRFETRSCPTRLSIQLMGNACKSGKRPAASMEPSFFAYLNNDLFSSPPTKDIDATYLGRNKRKHGDSDECSPTYDASNGVQIFNGLECLISCSSSMVSYVTDTEDVLHRRKRRKCGSAAAFDTRPQPLSVAEGQNYHQFLSTRLRAG